MIPEYQLFQETVWDFYAKHQRTLPWRLPEADGSFDPYKIMVSELMLQQTQVNRVIPKFNEFIDRFPTVEAVAAAPLADVLTVWSGLGYNRRAKFLHQAAQQVCAQDDGLFPSSLDALVALPGVGHNTAGAILVYAFNQPEIFIETNIRTVFIHHFFRDADKIPDNTLIPIVAATLDMQEPRQWFWALMDYGSYLKQTVGNLSRASKSYTKQSPFHGSRRQLRGLILKVLTQQASSQQALAQQITDDRLGSVLYELVTEGLIHKQAGIYHLGSI